MKQNFCILFKEEKKKKKIILTFFLHGWKNFCLQIKYKFQLKIKGQKNFNMGRSFGILWLYKFLINYAKKQMLLKSINFVEFTKYCRNHAGLERFMQSSSSGRKIGYSCSFQMNSVLAVCFK